MGAPEALPIEGTALLPDVYLMLKRAQRGGGLAKLKIGAMLCLLEDSEGWRGRSAARSFVGFLKEEGLEPTASRQYMRVARVFVLQLELKRDTLERFCDKSMRVLEKAAGVVTAENLELVIEIITHQPRPEAIESLEALGPGFVPEPRATGGPSKQVRSILSGVSELTHEQKMELYAALRVDTSAHNRPRPA